MSIKHVSIGREELGLSHTNEAKWFLLTSSTGFVEDGATLTKAGPFTDMEIEEIRRNSSSEIGKRMIHITKTKRQST